MNKVILSLTLILSGVAVSMVGDIFLKKSGVYNHKLLVLGTALYALGAIPVAFAFKKIDFGSVFLIWEAATVVSALIIASLVFKEEFSIYKLIALILALTAVYFSYK